MQRSAEWFAQRRGKLTGSNLASCLGLVSYTSRQQAYARAIGEEVTVDGVAPEPPVNPACEHGVLYEPVAIRAYEKATGYAVQEAQFVLHPKHAYIGASPDGYIGNEGMVEVKCPYYIQKPHNDVPLHYYVQINCQLACTGRKWCDFVSWTSQNGMNIIRVFPDHILFDWLQREFYDQLYLELKDDSKTGFSKMKSGVKETLKEVIGDSLRLHKQGNQSTLCDFWHTLPGPDPFEESSDRDFDGDTDDALRRASLGTCAES